MAPHRANSVRRALAMDVAVIWYKWTDSLRTIPRCRGMPYLMLCNLVTGVPNFAPSGISTCAMPGASQRRIGHEY